MPKKPGLDELNKGLKKTKPSAYDVYQRYLNNAMAETAAYAQQSGKNRQEVANTILGGGPMTSLKQGDIGTFNWDNQRMHEIGRAAANKAYRTMGLFDDPRYATNKGYVSLVSDKYLNSQLADLQNQLANFEQRQNALYERNKANLPKYEADKQKAAEWRNFFGLAGLDGEPTLENMLAAEGIYNGTTARSARDFDLMDDETFDREYAALESWYKGLDPAALMADPEAPTLATADNSAILNNIGVVHGEIDRRAQLNALQNSIRSDANYSTLSAYTDTYVEPDKSDLAYSFSNQPFIQGYDDLSRFINTNATWAEKTVAAEYSAKVRGYLDNGYDYMTQDELADYNALINAGRTEEAAQYLDLLSSELLYRRAMVMQEYQRVKATNPWLAVPTWVEAGIQQVENVFNLPQQIYEAAVGKDNPYSSAYDALNRSQWTTESQVGAINNADIPDWADTALTFLYKGVSGARDNAARIIAGGGNPTVALVLAGAQSASGSLHESSERNDMNGAAKIIKAIGTAAIEVGTEKIGLDALFDKGQKGALQYMKNVILSEVGEETLNAVSEPMLEAVVAYLFDHEAEIVSGPEFWKNLTDTAITTAISSIFMGGGGAISNEVGTRSIGRDVTKNGDLEGVLRIAESYSNNADVATPAQKIRDKQAKGFKVSNRDVGELVTAVSGAIGEKNSKAVTDVLDTAIEDRLEELGEDPENAMKLAPALRNVYQGKKLTMAERASLKWTDTASQVLKEMNIETQEGDERRVGHSWKTDADTKLQAAQRDALLEETRFTEALTTKTSATTAVGKAHDKAKNLMSGKPKMATREVMAEGSDGKEVTGTFERVERKNGKLLMVMKDASDAEVKVDADKITNGGDEGILTIINYAQEGARHEMSADEVNTMVNTYLHEGGDVDSFVQQFQDNYLSGYSGVNAPASTISGGIAAIAYEQGKAEAIKDEADRVARANKARKVETPTVGWLGDVTSDAQIKGLGDTAGIDTAMGNMTDTQRGMVEFGKQLAKSAKINIAFFASKASEDGKFTTQNGSYDPHTHTIYLDINSGASTESGRQELMKSGTLGAAIGRVAGHELTHVLEATSPEYYGKYKQAVKAALKAKNLDYASLVREKIDAALANGEKLTYAGAEAEVIADASEYMLQDSKFVKNMDQGLKGKVKEIVQKFLNKVNEAFRALTGGHIESAVLRTMTDGVAHYEKQLQDLWDMAFDEMLGVEVRNNAMAEAEELSDINTQFSIREEKIQYAIRDGLITTESTEQERYNILKDVVLKLARVNTGRLEDVDLDAYNTRKKSSVEKGIRALANKLGITNVDLENSYIDFPFQFTNKNLGKSLHHQLDYGGTYQDYVKAMSCFDELVENAIPIETHPDKKLGTVKGNTDLKQVYVLVSAFKDSNRVVPVQFEIKEYRGNNGKLYMMVALTKITPEVVEAPGVRNAKVPAPLFSGDIISLRYLFENVNSSDYKFFKYVPDGFLNDDQRAAKARALSDQAEEYASYGKDDDSSPDGIEIDEDTESAYPTQKSIRTWAESDYVAHRNEAAERLAKTIGVSTAKAKKWIDDVNSISAYILGNKARLDYIPTAVKGMSAFKSNPEYGGSIDMSTICAKRRLATGTLDAIQRVLGDAVLTKDDFLHIREMMKERGHEVACGLCFVESSRKNLSKYNKQFLDQYKAEHPDSELGMVDLNTVEGLERIRSNPETADVYAAYEKFMNKLAQRKPKLFEKRTEYNHEILKKFKSDTTVGVKNRNGGLRLQSFSDFEIVHLIDMMQVVTDMASVGLAGQAYTKVPDFAWALGDTGLKINLSLIAKDVDADGNLIFDDVEGMNHLEAEKLRNAYSKNVGTIVVTFTDEQTIAAMKSDFIDYIIPFHRSQWQKGDYKTLGLPEGTKDYTIHQNEKEGRKRVKENFLPNAYWQDDLSGTENAEYYLDMCAKAGRTPKFAKFLVNNGDGSYSLQPDGSTDGYWKLLIDFKMYDNDGNRSKQLPVQPNFNMDQAMRMLEDYKGEHDSFPVAQDVVDAFVKEYRGDVGGVKNTDGRYTVSPVQKSIRDLPEDTVTYRDYLTEADSSIAATIEERNALSIYQKLLKNHAEASERVIDAEAALAAADEAHKPEARKVLAAARVKQKDLYNRLLNVERQTHVQTLVKRSNQIIGDLYGMDQAELDKMLADKERRIASLKADLTGLKGAARTQREADIREQEREVAALKSKATKALLANSERYQRQIDEIRLRRDINIEIGKRTRHIKRIVKRLNDRIIHEEDYKNVKEPLKPVVHKLVQTFIDGFGNMVFDQKTADRLRSVYDEIANEDGAPEFYSDDVANWLSELSDMKEWDALIRAEGSSSLSAAEEKLTAYSRVAEIADHIYKLVTAADEIFIDGKREKFNAFSTETGTSLIERKDSKLLVGKARDAYNAFQNLLVKGNLTPQFFFEHLKNSGMTRLFDGLMRGQTEYAQAIREGQEAISDAKKRYNFYSWQNMKTGVQFHTEQGHDIALTVPQMMWVYATAKREATNKLMDTHHLDQGGFRYEAKDLPKQKGKMSAIPGSDRLHKLSQADVEKISNTLTAEQKACADELVSYLSNECATQGNRASMELFGIKKYNEEYYFPFKTASDQRYQRSDAGAASTTNDARVKHTSFTHSLRKGANTPLVMGDFFDVIADHINLMATYSSFVVPIESMNRVMNTKINEEADGSGNDVTIRSLIGRKYGEASQKYIADLLKDLNGGPQTDNRGGLSALFRAFKRGAVMGSLSVTLQQPTAIIRAFAYVNPKYFAHLTMEGNKKTWERMMKHSGTAVIKEMGKFDVGTGHMANDWIANSDIQEYNVLKRAHFLMKTEGWKAVKDNTIEFLTSMPGVMDRITWTHIWKAVEAEQADQHPGMDRNSDEFLDMVGKRFDDVINHTQVYDSVLAKSQNMRSKNPLTQMSTAFMSEPTLNANLYYSAVTGDHTAGQRAGIVTSVIASNLLAAAMAALISAWNKDDDDRKFTEKYLAAFASRAVDNLNPMTMYPYLSDLWSMVSGYDIERTDMSVVQDIWNYGSTFYKKLAEGEGITWRDRENFYGTIANLFGIPAKNVSRDIRRIRNLITTDKSASSPSAIKYTLYENAIPLGLWKDSSKAYCQRLVAAVVDGDKQEAYGLWDYLTNTKKPSQNTINTNIRDELKRRVQEGSLTPEQATEILQKYAPYKNDKDNLNKPKEWAE